MSEYKKSFNRRAFLVYAVALVFGIACIIQILNLAIWQRPLFSGDPEYCLDKTRPNWENSPLAKDPNCRCVVVMNDIAPERGDILDDQNNILASNFTVFDIVIDGRKLRPDTLKNKKGVVIGVNDTLYATKDRKISRSDKEAVNKLIAELSDQFYFHFKHKFLLHSKEHYRKKLTEAILEYKNVDILKSNLLSENTLITSEDTAFVRKLPLFQDRCKKKCIGFFSYFKRIYPYGELAKRVIGTVPPGAKSGLELTFNDWLSGKKGAQKMLYIDGVRVPSEKFSSPHDGANVHSTLNLRMQNIVYEALMDKLHQMGAQWGCAVIMEVNSGEIKAMANLKRHTNENGKVGYFEIFNHAFRQECEPGSTFKLASLLAYLEKVPNDTAKSYMLCGCDIAKHFARDGKKFRTKCSTAHRLGKPIEIFQRSLNEGTGTMIFDAYNTNYQNYLSVLDSMGITMPLETQMGRVGAPKIIRDTKSMRTFYITTWGGFNMAPIQTLTYFNGVANNGKMVCPKMVSHITERDKVVEIFPTVVLKEQMVRKDVISRAQKYLEAVVSGPHGTARIYKDSVPNFAGKTGTRDILVESEDGEKWLYDRSRNSISFCGYFPVDKPKYSMIVYIYDVKSMSGPAVQLFYTIAKRITSLETTDLMREVDKSGGIKNTIYVNLGK
ncbi:MAG: penicillin-binding transpeptidase domain-containing protein [Lentimicrobiaceae bacterium]|nr:penicillin-binding transpeptidase domain-containing protein [Lentimicrobiaceae bacterium]